MDQDKRQHYRQTGFFKISTLVLLILLVLVVIHEQYPGRIYRRIFPPVPVVPQPADNPLFREQLSFYPLYQQKMQWNIVMLGTSLTRKMEWTELLGRTDVANRGVNGDLTAGMLQRLPAVISLRPAICFIEGGANDVDYNIPDTVVSGNLQKIALELRKNHIIPVLVALTHVTRTYPSFQAINAKVNAINAGLHRFAGQEHIPLIDLTRQLGDDLEMKAAFAQADGVHLQAAAYLIWKKEIEQQLLAHHL